MYLEGALHCLNGFVTQVRVLKENRKNVTYRQTDRLTDRRTDVKMDVVQRNPTVKFEEKKKSFVRKRE